MKIAIVFAILFVSGCISQPSIPDEVTVLDVESVIDYYSLDGYTGRAGEAFYVIAGDVSEAKKTLNEVIVQQLPVKTTFAEDDTLNLVVFRGVFHTGGYGIKIDKVERTGSSYVVHATYTNPGKGMMVTQAFTQPAAIIPIGKLPESSYEAKLKVTKILEDEDGKRILEEDKEHASITFMVK